MYVKVVPPDGGESEIWEAHPSVSFGSHVSEEPSMYRDYSFELGGDLDRVIEVGVDDEDGGDAGPWTYRYAVWGRTAVVTSGDIYILGETGTTIQSVRRPR